MFWNDGKWNNTTLKDKILKNFSPTIRNKPVYPLSQFMYSVILEVPDVIRRQENKIFKKIERNIILNSLPEPCTTLAPAGGWLPSCTDRKPTRSSSPLGTCGQRPRAFNCLLGPSSGNCVASAYGEQRKPQLAIAPWPRPCSEAERNRIWGQTQRMGRGEGPGGVSLKQEWQMDFILRADVDQLLLAAWRWGQGPCGLETDSV